jgi:large subunit ribosomal protein L14
MIQMGTIVKVSDNSGILRVKCLKILGRCRRELAGEKLRVSVHRAKPHRKLRKGNKARCYVAGTAKWFRRLDGSSIRFGRNTVIMLGRRGAPLGTRVRGPVLKEFKDKVVVRTLGIMIRTV